MHAKQLHFPSVGVLGLLVGALLRVLAFMFHWPLGLVYLSEVALLIGILWIVMFDLFPIFLQPFYIIRHKYSRRKSFFIALIILFVILQVVTRYLPSSRTKDVTSTLAFLSFMSAIVWFFVAYVVSTFTPLVRYLKRKPREAERIRFSDVVTSMAVIFVPTALLSFAFTPTGLSTNSISPYQVFLTSAITDLIMGAYVYLLVIRPKVFSLKQLGIRKVDLDDWRHALGVFTVAAVVVVGIQMLLMRLGVPLHQFSFTTKDGSYLLLITTVFVSPLIEEIYFRGYIFRGLLLHNPVPVAFITSSLLFALLHPPIVVMAEVFIIGLVLCYLIKETKSIWPGVLIHMLNNAIVFGYWLYS